MSDGPNDLFNRPEGAPDGPDFWALSNVVLRQDGRIEAAVDSGDIEEAYNSVLAEAGVTHEAIHYMAQQRAYRLLGISTAEEAERSARMIGAMAAMFLDGFMVGSGFERGRKE
jgi:hypothetical protein